MIAKWLKDAKNTVVFTGAGMSTESGLPDFRSAKQGLWREKDPMQLASTHAMKHNRKEFIEFYRMRIEGLFACVPHAGHNLLAEWEAAGLIKGVITQNVDGFHQQAGSKQVAELHGSLRTVYCSVCGRSFPAKRYLSSEGTACQCGGFLRPSVVLFGESLPMKALTQAETMISQADFCLVLGSSLQVSPANYYPQIAKANGARLVIVNMEPTELDHIADLVINGRKIGDVLQEVKAELTRFEG
jgi:NAD-dependent deacetylase